MSVQMKYLQDENGEIFSPVTSSSSIIFSGDTSANSSLMSYRILWEGSCAIPSLDSGSLTNLTIVDDIGNYDYLIVIRAAGCSIVKTKSAKNGYQYQPVVQLGSTYNNEKQNSFLMTLTKVDSTTVSVGNSVYCPHHKDGTTTTHTDYVGHNLRMLIGIKLM